MHNLHPHHVLFSSQNPKYKSSVQIPSIEEVVKFLNRCGEDAQIIDGHYEVPEKSILVSDPKNLDGLFSLAKDFGQESVLHSQNGKNSLKYLNGPRAGKSIEGSGTVFTKEKPDGNYSLIHTVDGPLYFKHNLNFDPTDGLLKSEILEKALSPSPKIRQVADQYAQSKGLKLDHGSPVVKVNPERSKKIAQAYHTMSHNPAHPEVQKAYGSLINETLDQFDHIKKTGLKISKISKGMENPYKSSSDLFHDVNHNNHMWFFPTEGGYGSGQSINDHPMLSSTREMHEGSPLLANDIFRIVHDYFGHVKEGHGFGPNGEENAWKNHMQMYSPDAQKALTAETRGQNSWVNFGPHSEHNRANPSKTIYADQKAGLLPAWAMEMDKINKSEDLNKAPLPHYPSPVHAGYSLPNLHNMPEDFHHVKTTVLPNKLEYHQFISKNSIPEDKAIVHALYDPRDKTQPLAYMETRNVEDAMSDGGYHPNVVSWSEVHPDFRGKGLGRQLYLASLLHVGHLTSDERVSPEAHKAWLSFRQHPGLGGKIGKYPKSSNELLFRPDLAGAYEADRHHIFVRDRTKVDMLQMFPPTIENLAASEKKLSLEDIKESLEKPQEDEIIDIPEHTVIQWSTHRW